MKKAVFFLVLFYVITGLFAQKEVFYVKPNYLFKAVYQQDLSWIKQILSRGIDPDTTDPDGNTPLIIAVSEGNLPMVKMLWEYGSDINQKVLYGLTHLMFSCLYNNYSLAKFLVEKGAFLNINVPKNYQGVRVTTLSNFHFKEIWERRKNLSGQYYYWSTIRYPKTQPETGSDWWAINNKFVSVTPLNIEVTAYKMLKTVEKWLSER
jgi:hypothetical protein